VSTLRYMSWLCEEEVAKLPQKVCCNLSCSIKKLASAVKSPFVFLLQRHMHLNSVILPDE